MIITAGLVVLNSKDSDRIIAVCRTLWYDIGVTRVVATIAKVYKMSLLVMGVVLIELRGTGYH